jgi:hypothetical protein
MVGEMIGAKYTHSREGVAFVGGVESTGFVKATTDTAFKIMMSEIDERQN